MCTQEKKKTNKQRIFGYPTNCTGVTSLDSHMRHKVQFKKWQTWQISMQNTKIIQPTKCANQLFQLIENWKWHFWTHSFGSINTTHFRCLIESMLKTSEVHWQLRLMFVCFKYVCVCVEIWHKGHRFRIKSQQIKCHSEHEQTRF